MPQEQEIISMRLVSYARVSTKKQLLDGTLRNQHLILKHFEDSRADLNIVKHYEDQGISSFKERPSFDQMMEDVLIKDLYDGIVITKLSRIGRSVKQLVDIVDELEKKGKKLIIIKDNIDTSNPQNRLFFHVLCALNEYEVALFKERSKEGTERYIEEGGRLGRKPKNLDIREAIKLYKHPYELGITKIAKILNDEARKTGRFDIVSRSAVRNALIEAGIKMRTIKRKKKEG